MVQKIDEALLRKRSEHNDKELTTLKEISLHQFDIEKIENLDIYCRNLEILFLQSNQISKIEIIDIENLNKLKRLQYLQLALNNIRVIENLQGCESLEKLDLTVNFIEDLLCVENLKENLLLKQLYLVGNPCTEIPGYRSFVIASLPQLKLLDGKEIEKSERIVAQQEFHEIRKRLLEARSSKVTVSESSKSTTLNDLKLTLHTSKESFVNQITEHTPEARIQTARELEQLRKKETRHLEPQKPKERILFGPDGRVLQKNEGKWQYKWSDNSKSIRLGIEISKFLDTSLIKVDCHPTYISIWIKNKLLQLTFSESVRADTAYCERSKLTGELAITVVKESFKEIVDISKELSKVAIDVKLTNSAAKSLPKNKRYSNLFTPTESVDYRNLINEGKFKKPTKLYNGTKIGSIIEQSIIKPELPTKDFVDDPDVPPLC